MKEITKQLLKWKNIGFIRFNLYFDIVEIDEIAKTILKSITNQWCPVRFLHITFAL